MYKITIILPTFNVEKHLKKSLNSLLSQTIGFFNLQIIYVNDCSTDNSGHIIDQYADKYDNIISVHLSENSGAAGKPRNEGIKYALSDYLLFLDPDDYLLDNACEVLFNKITKTGADIVVGGYAKSKEWIVQWYTLSKNEESYIIDTVNNLSIFMNPPGLAAKLFKKKLIIDNQITFAEHIPGQDLVFVIECFLNANSILTLNNFIVYCYYHTRNDENDKSISNNVTIKYIYNLLTAYQLTLDLFDRFDVNDSLRNVSFVMNHIPFFTNQLKKLDLDENDQNSLFNSFLFLKLRNQRFILENKKLNNYFEKLIEDYRTVNADELKPIWQNVRENFIKSNDYVNEKPYSGELNNYIYDSTQLIDFENEMQIILNKISKLNNKLNGN